MFLFLKRKIKKLHGSLSLFRCLSAPQRASHDQSERGNDAAMNSVCYFEKNEEGKKSKACVVFFSWRCPPSRSCFSLSRVVFLSLARCLSLSVSLSHLYVSLTFAHSLTKQQQCPAQKKRRRRNNMKKNRKKLPTQKKKEKKKRKPSLKKMIMVFFFLLSASTFPNLIPSDSIMK